MIWSDLIWLRSSWVELLFVPEKRPMLCSQCRVIPTWSGRVSWLSRSDIYGLNLEYRGELAHTMCSKLRSGIRKCRSMCRQLKPASKIWRNGTQMCGNMPRSRILLGWTDCSVSGEYFRDLITDKRAMLLMWPICLRWLMMQSQSPFSGHFWYFPQSRSLKDFWCWQAVCNY